MTDLLHPSVTFGPFAVDRARRLLWRDGQTVALTAKAFDVLVALIERRGRIVSKDELLSEIWPDTQVQENNLVRQISTLRRALDQRPDQHDYIVTVPGQGYQFVAAVRETPADPPTPPAPIDRDVPRDDLAAAISPAPQPTGARSTSMPRTAWLAAGLVGILAVGTVAATFRPRTGGTTDTRDLTRRVLQRVTYEAGLARHASWSPDGRWIVFASDRGTGSDLWKQRVGEPDAVRVTNGGAGDSQPQWSPDGRSIVFRSERDGGGLFVVPVDGGPVQRITDFGYEPRWAPDGSLVLFTRSGVLPASPGLYIVGLDGRPPQMVRPDLLREFSTVRAAWHPDGGRVSLWGRLRSGEIVFLTAPLDGRTPARALVADAVRSHVAALSPGPFVWARSGRHLFFEAGAADAHNIWRIAVDPSNGRWIDGPTRLTTGAAEDVDLALSPDGTRLLFTTRATKTRIWAFPYDADTGRVTDAARPVTTGGAGEVDGESSPDGAKLAYTASRAGRQELWERSIADGRERLLASSSDTRYSRPRWSPDGTRLAYMKRSRTSPTLSAVMILGLDGLERAITKPGDVEFVPTDWSRDGTAVLGACRFSMAERFGICLMPLSSAGQVGGPTIRVLASDPRRDLFNERFSPDHEWIAFLALDAADVSTSTVYAMPAGGGRWSAISDGLAFDDKPRWRPDGQAILFVTTRGGVANVWGRRFDRRSGAATGRPFPLTAFRSPQFALTSRTAEMDIAISANHLFLPIAESQGEVWMLDQVDR